MIRRRLTSVCLAGLVAWSGAAAQTRVGAAAATHWSGSTLWLGGDLAVERSGLGLRLVGSGSSPEKRLEAEGRAVLDYRVQWGPVRASLGIAGLRRTGPGVLTGLGPIGSTTVEIGDFTVSGDFSRLATIAQSASGIATDPRDTLSPVSAAAPALGHIGLGARWSRGRYALDGRILQRTGVGLRGQVGWLAGAGLRIAPWSSLAASVGRLPAPEALYLPLRHQVTIGLVFAAGRLRARPRAAGTAGTFLEVAPVPGGYRVRVRIPDAARVEVNGDFTSWQPVDMARAESEVWETTLALRSGVYHLNLRIDGGPWTVPAGLAATSDGFGGRTGVLLIP